MIHECLLNLWRCSMPLKSNKNWTHLFELNEYLHPGELRLFQMIIDIAVDYHKINYFITTILHKNLMGMDLVDCKLPRGLYMTAFCNGFHEVLDGYRKEIIKLESLLLKNPQLSLTFILSSLEKFQYLFQTLLSMIEVVQEDNVHGCLLIGRLYKYGYGEAGQITASAKLIIKSLCQIFHKHICNWIIFGDLVDSYGEFFILDEKTPDMNFMYPEQVLELKQLQGEASKNIVQFKKSKMRRLPYVQKFSINWNMIPIFINEDTAENILFMGRIIWIIRNDPKKTLQDNYTIKFEKCGKDHYNQYYETLQELEDTSFSYIEFQRVIEKWKKKLTTFLWSIMLDEGKFEEHLYLIRDYFALGRGELFQQFIAVTKAYLEDTSSNSAIQSFNFIFIEAARMIYGQNDKTYMKFELTSSSDIAQTNPWTKLQLNFEISWPLHVVFHPGIMCLYNKLFCFLLRLKKTQIDLHKLWIYHVSKKQKRYQQVWTLRQNLIFMVNNIQYYLQVDVIEAQFSLLLKAIQNASEFEDIIKVHHDFITNLLVKTFIATTDEKKFKTSNKQQLYQVPPLQFETPSKVYNIIIKLLELCDEFCIVSNSWGAQLSEPQLAELETFQKRSDTIIETFLFILYNLHEKVASGQHLLQLLLQLDFNRYFSKTKPNLNLTEVV